MSEVTIKSAFRYNLDLAQHLLLNRCLFSRNASDILKDANISEQVDHTWQLQRVRVFSDRTWRAVVHGDCIVYLHKSFCRLWNKSPVGLERYPYYLVSFINL